MGPKRTSGAAGSPAKRAKAEVNSRIKQVVQALNDADLLSEVPMQAREMLAKGAPSALKSAVEERHELQDKVLSHIRETLSEINSRLTATKASAEAAAGEAAAALEASKADLASAAEVLDEAQKGLDAAQDKLSEAKQAAHAAEAELKKANHGVKASQKTTDHIEKEKAKFTSFPEKPEWKALMSGECETEKDRHKFIRAIVSQFSRLGAEEALLASAPAALSKGPEDRKSFDTMVIDSLTKVLKAGEEDCDAKLQDVATERASLDAEAASKTEIFNKAQAVKDEHTEEASKLEAVRDEKATAKEAREARVAECAAAVDERGAERAAAEEGVSDFTEVFQSLDYLASRSLAPAEPEAADADPAPAEDAAPAEEVSAAA